MKLTRRVLHLPAKECVFDFPVANQHLADSMLEIMIKSKGIGLAAPQVGILKRLFVMALDNQTYRCFNPEVIDYGQDREIMSEGCLSFPGQECKIARSKEIIVRYSNAHGSATEEKMTGLLARCFQHELDHLDGIVMQQRTPHAE